MKKASYIFEIMKQHLHSEEFLKNNRVGHNSFLRRRLLPFSAIFLFILNMLRKSIPKEVIGFCKNCNLQETFCRSAVTKARAKLDPKAYIEMNHVLVKEFYTDNPVERFHGFITLAIDGSTGELPIDSPQILDKYGCASNQTETKIPMARTSTLYDTVNGIILDGIIAPYSSSERGMVIQHFESIRSLGIGFENFLAVFDRGYPSVALFVYLIENGINFLMRSNNQFLKEVKEVVKTGKRDEIIQVSLKKATPAAKADLKELFPSIDLKKTISLRVVVVTLNTGEKEVLITSLLSKEKYPYKIFRELYFKRWSTEENYKFIKVSLEVENFSGKSCIAIEQDFHATVLAANSRALLAVEASQELAIAKNGRTLVESKKYKYEINKNVSIEALKHEFVGVLLDPYANLEVFCKKTKDIMKENLIPIRPGRSFKRIRKHPKKKFHMNLR